MPILAKAPDTVFDWQSESLTQAYPSLPFHSLSFLSVAFLKTKADRIKWSISQISVKTLNLSSCILCFGEQIPYFNSGCTD